MYATAVVGGMYGDEGKGTLTAFLCKAAKEAKVQPIVIRHNGGAQSGHTVKYDKNIKHIFKHIGAGTFENAPTILSKFFVSNPILFKKEFEALKDLGFYPKIYLDRRSYVTLPIDMIINQIVENHRGIERHGSVGLGFGETIERSEWNERYLINPFTRTSKINEIYDIIFNEWINKRLYTIGLHHIKDISSYFQDIINFDLMKKDFIDSYEFLMDNVNEFYGLHKLTDYESIIFEGGQGLALDMDYGTMPHVTRSRTGIFNALEFCKEENISLDEVIYCTRSYTTRHGNGPLDFECKDTDLRIKGIIDETNIPHDYQGSLRFSPLNLDLFFNLNSRDSKLKSNIKVSYMMSWLDELPENIKIILYNKLLSIDKYTFKKLIDKLGFNFRSYGPYYREQIKEVLKK